MKRHQHKNMKISVRQLVEFVLRGGDLDSKMMGKDRGIEGTRAHQQVQRTYQSQDQAEVSLAISVEVAGSHLEIKGRADGILFREEGVFIDEIKSVTRPLDTLGEMDNPLHWGQAKVYAFIYGQEQGLETIGVQLTYFHLGTEEIRQSRRQFTLSELSFFFHQLCQAYVQWGEWLGNWRFKRDTSISTLVFPFSDYRKGQRSLAVGVYRTIKDRKRLFAKAPTGIGKTMSTLFPAIKAMGEGYTDKLFYLTAKTITRSVAEESFRRLGEKGLSFKALTITAKDKICFLPEAACDPEECPYARGYFDRLNRGLADLFEQEDLYTREVVAAYAEKHTLCPFEFSLEIALWADCVICDYNYVFDPRVYLKRFFFEIQEAYTFLVDEAHNLVDRGREMYSAELTKESFLEIKRRLKESGKEVAKRANQVNTQFLKLKKTCTQPVTVTHQPPDILYNSLYTFLEAAEDWLLERARGEDQEALLELYFQVVGFLRIAELYDERYATLLEQQDKDLRVRLYCLDPSYLLDQAFHRGSSAVCFSATLAPLPFFREMLGGAEEDYALSLESPFERDNLCLMVADQISTRYRHREETVEVVCSYLHEAVKARTGNYFVFFPSYRYMTAAYTAFFRRYPQINLIKQQPQMTEQEREAFLEAFHQPSQETLLGFTVLGGVFSEGIDLPGDRLIGVVVVGVGLPQLCTELDTVRGYFQKTKGMGYQYAYQYPGFNRVLQAAGRVIRTETDRGFVLLIDSRYDEPGYRHLFPAQWRRYTAIRNRLDIRRRLAAFWGPSQRE